MDPEIAKRIFENNVTRTTHRTPYPSVDPSRPGLSQKGRTVLITGGSAGVGFAIAKAFVAASASAVIISGRRQEQLDIAVSSLTKEAAETGTRIIGEKSDAADPESIDKLWADLAERNIVVDVLVLNAAKFATPGSLLSLGITNVWKSFEFNARSLLLHTEKFHQQPKGSGPRVRFLWSQLLSERQC